MTLQKKNNIIRESIIRKFVISKFPQYILKRLIFQILHKSHTSFPFKHRDYQRYKSFSINRTKFTMIPFIRSRLPSTSDNSSLKTSSSQASFFTNLLLHYPPIVFSRSQEKKNASLSCNIGLSTLTKRLSKVHSIEDSLWGKENCDWPGGKVTSVHAG